MAPNTSIEAFDYVLPKERIAQFPLSPRSASRMLVASAGGELVDDVVTGLVDRVTPEDLLVFNDTRVLPARLLAHKPTGARVEVLLERVLEPNTALCQLGSNKRLRSGQELVLDDGTRLTIRERRARFFVLESAEPMMGLFERLGSVPLPPYIDRSPAEADAERYQTVFARSPGAVAAPTAGLHFDEPLLAALDAKQCRRLTLTLHVGAGTFAPVRSEDIRDHRMHSEYVEISQELADAVIATRARGGRVIAVGTTVVRALESAAAANAGRPFARYDGLTDLFIYPGYRFNVVDMLLTNFHLPKSTLLMMVSAFAGSELIRRAYDHALANEYRFFSYGDAMLLARAE